MKFSTATLIHTFCLASATMANKYNDSNFVIDATDSQGNSASLGDGGLTANDSEGNSVKLGDSNISADEDESSSDAIYNFLLFLYFFVVTGFLSPWLKGRLGFVVCQIITVAVGHFSF